MTGGTVTTVLIALEPAAFVHVSVYVEFPVIPVTGWEPLTAIEPGQAPEAVHDVALVDDQVERAAAAGRDAARARGQ